MARKTYSWSGPHRGTTYPEWEVVETDPSSGKSYTVAYLHRQEHAETLAGVLNKRKERKLRGGK